MRRLTLSILLPLLLAAPGALAGPPSAAKADKRVQRLVKERRASPGGVFRIQRFPVPVEKGWTISEDREESTSDLTIDAPGWFYFVDTKAGPMYEHAVEFLVVSRTGRKTSVAQAAWWPVVRDADGVVVHATGKEPVEDEEPWWTSEAYRFLGDTGPSIQDAQDAVKMDWMFAPLPSGSRGLVMYACPCTLPVGGAVTVEGAEAPLANASGESFVFFVDFHRGDAWPHAARIVLWTREGGVATTIEVEQPPILLGTDGEPRERDDAGRPLGSWWADDVHSFLARMSFSGR